MRRGDLEVCGLRSLPVDPLPGSPAWWDARYRDGDAPWDTGIVPPEVAALVETGQVTPGWALDLGCGSGVSSRYLARHGFRVVGVDLASTALARAQLLATAEDVTALFCLGDVTDLAFLNIQATLAIDVGCFHSIPAERRSPYVSSLAARLLGRAHYLLYAFEPFQAEPGRPSGIGPREIGEFAPHFALCWSQHGWDRERPSAWYLFRRKPVGPRAVGR